MSRLCCYAASLLLLSLGIASQSADNIKNKGWWKNMPFYQIYPRSFMDNNGDGIGDLKGITSRLEHFVDAGIGAIWLSPIYKSPMKDFGYDISDFVNIQPEYGTMADFEALTTKAKELQLKVILDLVPNHSSDEHDWFARSVKKEKPYKDFYIWRAGDASKPPNNWLSVFGGPAWTFHPVRQEWYFHQFLAKQPDLNYRNPYVKLAMQEVILFWLEKGVNGFRIDAVPHLYEVSDLRDEPLSNTPGATKDEYTYLNHLYTKDQPETYQLVKSWRQVVDDYANDAGTDELVIMTEAYTSLEKTVEFYDAGAHVPFNFKFIIDVNKDSPPSDFKKIIDSWMAEADKRNGTANWVMGNHDRKRTETRYPMRGDQMMMLSMILPGVSVTYYGEEIGMVDKDDITWKETQDPQGCQAGEEKYKEKSRDPCRTPFQWENKLHAGFSTNTTGTWIPVNANYPTLNLAIQKATPDSHYNLFRNLTKLKTGSATIANGTLTTLVKNNDKVLVIMRTRQIESVVNETIILIMNFDGTNTQTVDLKNDIPANIALNGTVIATSQKPAVLPGGTIGLETVFIDKNAAYVISANKLRVKVSGAGTNRISLMNVIVALFATLFMTLR